MRGLRNTTAVCMAKHGRRQNFRLFALLLLIAAAPVIDVQANGQERPVDVSSSIVSRRPERHDKTSIRLDVERVLVPVTVVNSQGRKVEGLHKGDFRVYLDGVQQNISDFFMDEAPVSLGIILDASHSMHDRIDPALNALRAFLRVSLPGDEFSLITVRDRPTLVFPFTTHRDEIERELTGLPTVGWTALYDGIYLGVNRAKKASVGDRVLLVLSDGGDNNSRYTASEIKNIVRESDVRIFSISIEGRSPTIEKLALDSGGWTTHVQRIDELSEAAFSLSALIHGEYVVGFSPASLARDGKYHQTKVEVTQPADGTRLYASWRRGFYAPIQ
jgi:Ca-activated chloride channel homolog